MRSSCVRGHLTNGPVVEATDDSSPCPKIGWPVGVCGVECAGARDDAARRGTAARRKIGINNGPEGETRPEDWRLTEYDYGHYHPGIQTVKVSAITPEEVGFDRDSRTFSASSPLARNSAFGREWIAEWNEGFSDGGAAE